VRCLRLLPLQAALITEELLKSNPEVVKVLFNKFRSAISFKPTLATILTPQVRLRGWGWRGAQRQSSWLTSAQDRTSSHERATMRRMCADFT
jgi:F-type H+-transporting ATPase subunit gamma